MSENPFSNQGRVGIRQDKLDYAVAPSGNTTVTITLRNQGLEDDRFALAIGGIPAAWVSSSQPVVSLVPGEEKETDLIIQAPASGEVDLGEIQLTIRATSQQQPTQFSQVKAKLTIKTEMIPSRVAVELDSPQFSVAPGGSTTFSMQLKNNGLVLETLRLYIDGIPTGWVSTPFPVTSLDPGEEKKIPVTISPPRASESRAGRHPITIRWVSQQFPDQAAIQEAILTIGAFVEFQSELLPAPPIASQQNAQIKVSNAGNIHEAFQIKWESEEDILSFELWQKDGEEAVFKEVQELALQVEAGKQDTAYFRAGLRQRPFLGGSKTYPFQVQVSTSSDEVLTHESAVNDRGIIPVWVLPLVMVLCVSVVCLGVFIYNWLQEESPPVVTDDSWARVQEAGILKVATSADYPPYSYYNENYIIDGFDPALIREIGDKLGVQIVIEDFAFDGLGAALKVGQMDVAIAAISITPEREAQFGFSNIYYVGQDGVLARANSEISSITIPSDMAGKRVGVQQYTVYESWAQDVLVAGGIIAQDQLFLYSEPQHALDDLRHERIDLVIMDLQPATLALSDGDLQLVGQGLNQQRLAIALPLGADALRSKIDEALLILQNEGRVNQLVEIYLGLRPEDIIPPPTPQPTLAVTGTPAPTATYNPTPDACVDAMDFVEDLNFDDEDLTNFPLVDPGGAFEKGWRIKNTGTCIWNSTYFIKYSHGSDPAAQMGGQPTAIQGAVEPGQTYDIYVDLVTPSVAAKYVGYWQMHNTQNQAFGQTIWVAIEVRATGTAVPTATMTPQSTQTPPPTATQLSPTPTTTAVPAQPSATQEPAPTEGPGADLRDKTWILDGYLVDIEDDLLTDPIPNVEVRLIFKDGGELEGYAGCNTFRGDYVTNGTELAIQDINATRTICTQPAGIMEQEAAFLELLGDVEEYQIDDEELELIRYVNENNQPVEKIILLFYDLGVEPL